MTSIVLHVGHGKTGSSYLQSLFALNQEQLQRANVTYPFHKNLTAAAAGQTTSGNHSSIFSDVLDFAGRNTLLVSGETLFRTLMGTDTLAKISQTYKLKVILFTRDVVDHGISRWIQGVKGRGIVEDVDTYLTRNPLGPHPIVVEWMNLSRMLGFELRVRNYSRHKSDLVSVFCADAFDGRLDAKAFQLPDVTRVNRGLTQPELDIQRLFNAIIGSQSAGYVAKFLVSHFPESRGGKTRVSQKTYDLLTAANKPFVAAINRNLPPEEHVGFGDPKDVVRTAPSEQIPEDTIAALAENITTQAPFFQRRDGDLQFLLGLALRIEKGRQPELQDALKLMEMALAIRPGAPRITAKVDEWRKILEKDKNVDIPED
ncbi:hypothetical protein [uncultured Tateyamaria sp.]|uniref:hypothetical protein n=1 Tax=uncultured Tateyamaria sp. TaxID=455651 RepID=UPI0026291055|nr:hypothetical protein [uncultured Tateyamaria sp.]